MLSLSLFETISTYCTFVLVLYDPIFALSVNFHVLIFMCPCTTLKALKQWRVSECAVELGLRGENRTLLPSCSFKNQPELIWSPKLSCWCLLDLYVWFIFWMCFSFQLLHHSCFIMPCSNHVPYMESMHQACLNFSCHVSTVLCFAPNIWFLASHPASGARGDTMLKGPVVETEERVCLEWSWRAFWIPWLYTWHPLLAPRTALEQANLFGFCFFPKAATAGKSELYWILFRDCRAVKRRIISWPDGGAVEKR